MKVWLLDVMDWEAGERKVWAVFSTKEQAIKEGKDLYLDNSLDISYDVYSLNVIDE